MVLHSARVGYEDESGVYARALPVITGISLDDAAENTGLQDGDIPVGTRASMLDDASTA